jgi:Domain of unknown function (DUF4142)
VPVRTIPLAGVTALAVVALLGTSCGAGQPAGTAPPAATADPASVVSGEPPAGRAALPSSAGLPADQVGRAHQAALGLIALGALGAEKGTGEPVRGLGGQVTTDARAVDDRVRTLASGAGIVLGDDLAGPAQALLSDLGARTGQPFDQGWLRAVLDLTQQARDAADAVRASDASEEAKAAARDATARLDALAARLRDAAAGAGAGTPTAVDAGTGGQAAEAPVLPAALVGLGALLVGSAVVLRRGRG